MNYGVLGVLDWLHSTDAAFRSSRQYNQHKTYFSVSAYDNTAAAVRGQAKKGIDTEDEKKTTASAGTQQEERKQCQRSAGSGLGLMDSLEGGEL